MTNIHFKIISICVISAICGHNLCFAQNLFYNKAAITFKSSFSVYINGGLKSDGTASINNNGTVYIQNHSTPGNENWTNNVSTTMLFGSGTVVFNSSEPQKIGGSDTTVFYNLTINNTSSTGVTLDTPITVNSSLTLTDGILYTDATNLLILIDNAVSSSGSAASFIDGPMKKIGNDAFIFPVGDTAVWARIGISVPLNTTAEFIAEYFDGRHADANNTDGTLNNSSVVEYWILSRVFGASPDDDVQVTLHWEDSARSGINDAATTDLVVARYNGVNWTSEGQFSITNNDPGDVTSNTVSTFSPFTFGSLSGSVNPLPIELLDFKAKWDNNKWGM